MRKLSKSETITISVFSIVTAFVLGIFVSNSLIDMANKDNSVSDILAAIGTLGLFALGATTFFIWQRQLGASYLHERVQNMREFSTRYRKDCHFICEEIRRHKKLLNLDNNKDEKAVQDFLRTLSIMIKECRSSHESLNTSLMYMNEIASKNTHSTQLKLAEHRKGIELIYHDIMKTNCKVTCEELVASPLGDQLNLKEVFGQVSGEFDIQINGYAAIAWKELDLLDSINTPVAEYAKGEFKRFNKHW